MNHIKPRRILILGGGYAALSAAFTLHSQAPESRITLIAPRKAHIKLTRLHETLRYSLRHLCVRYDELGKRLGFQFIQAKLKFDTGSLLRWHRQGFLVLDSVEIPFDYLIVATGASPVGDGDRDRILGINDFCLNQAQTMLRNLCESQGKRANLSVIGGGATGIQFLFELSAYIKRQARRPCKLRLVNYGPQVLSQFPARFHEYALERMRREGIEYLPNTALLRQEHETLVLAHRDGGEEIALPSQMSLQFLGVKPGPLLIETNGFGQVTLAGVVLDRVFAAGDCARFAGEGANTLSAQVAIRKGSVVAGNVLCHGIPGQEMEAYGYVEKGYFVSLGPADCIGWWGSQEHIVTGLPALAIKKAAETQYDLMLAGIAGISG